MAPTERAGGHSLLTVLGIKPRESCYRLGEREVTSLLAPVALLELLPEADRPDTVLALCTPDAKEGTWPELERLLNGRAPAQFVEVPTGDQQEHVDEFLKRVAEKLPAGTTRITLDVTHGFRHFSFLTYIAGLYLSALSGLEIRGAYYGLLQQGVPVSPFLDLRPLLELPGWLHALKELEETGSARALARRLDPKDKKQIERLEHISTAFVSGLPLELGHETAFLLKDQVKPLARALRETHRLPRAEAIVKKLTDILEPYTLAPESQGWKKRTSLGRSELDRQAKLVGELFERGSYPAGLRLMREWTVSWACLSLGREKDWLSRESRHVSEARLWALGNLAGDNQLRESLSQEQRRLAGFWEELAELRNAFAHNGMRREDLFEPGLRGRLAKVQSDWTELLSGCPEISLEVSPAGAQAPELVLVCPLGGRPGVLFSAVRACTEKLGAPSDCLVVCSPQSEPRLQEALERAGYSGREPVRLRFQDPLAGLQEIDNLLGQARPTLALAGKVAVNLTGGTTLMGLACSALAREARELARPVVELGLVDRRPPTLQDDDPYQPGEALWLDGGKKR